MTTQEFFKEWSEKYPKSFAEFRRWLPSNSKVICFYHEYYKEITIENECVECENKDYLILPFEMLSGVIEKFFEENGIILYICCGEDGKKNDWYFAFAKNNFKFDDLMSSNGLYSCRLSAQMQAFLKAAEILEGTL